MGFFRVITSSEARIDTKATPKKINHWNKVPIFSTIGSTPYYHDPVSLTGSASFEDRFAQGKAESFPSRLKSPADRRSARLSLSIIMDYISFVLKASPCPGARGLSGPPPIHRSFPKRWRRPGRPPHRTRKRYTARHPVHRQRGYRLPSSSSAVSIVDALGRADDHAEAAGHTLGLSPFVLLKILDSPPPLARRDLLFRILSRDRFGETSAQGEGQTFEHRNNHR